KTFTEGRFFVMRTRNSASFFAWGSHVMGQTVPFRRERLVNPVPMSYSGLVADLPKGDRTPGRTGIGSTALAKALEHESFELRTVITGEESGAVFTTLNAAHGGQAHALSFTALPDGQSVYIDRWAG